MKESLRQERDNIKLLQTMEQKRAVEEGEGDSLHLKAAMDVSGQLQVILVVLFPVLVFCMS